VVARSPRSPGSGKPTAEGGGATRFSENHAIWDHLGMTEGKCFGILDEPQGVGVPRIAVIAVIGKPGVHHKGREGTQRWGSSNPRQSGMTWDAMG